MTDEEAIRREATSIAASCGSPDWWGRVRDARAVLNLRALVAGEDLPEADTEQEDRLIALRGLLEALELSPAFIENIVAQVEAAIQPTAPVTRNEI